MSFMFHPYPYVDHEAVNRINVPQSVENNLTKGILNTAKKIAAMFEDNTSIGIDAYPGTEYEALINVLRQQLAGKDVVFIDAASVLLPAEEITEMLKEYLPEDRDVDPVLLYGRRYREGYKGLQDAKKD